MPHTYRWEGGRYIGETYEAVSALTGFDGCAFHVRDRSTGRIESVGFGVSDAEEEVQRMDEQARRRRAARRSAPQLSLFKFINPTDHEEPDDD